MRLEGNRILSDDNKVIAEKERGYGDWISKDDSVSISDMRKTGMFYGGMAKKGK